MPRVANNPKLKKIIKVARGAGWRVEPTREGFAFYPPDGQPIVRTHVGGSTDPRWFKNIRADFRRSGLDIGNA